MKSPALIATLLIGAALAATSFAAPANASAQGDYMTMVAAQQLYGQHAAMYPAGGWNGYGNRPWVARRHHWVRW